MSKLTNKKSHWKQKVNRLQYKLEQFERRARAGDTITLGEVFTLGYKIQELGEEGHDLARLLAAEQSVSRKILFDIGMSCHHLETYSANLRILMRRRGMYDRTFPTYESQLDYIAESAIVDPLEQLDLIMSRGDTPYGRT